MCEWAEVEGGGGGQVSETATIVPTHMPPHHAPPPHFLRYLKSPPMRDVNVHMMRDGNGWVNCGVVYVQVKMIEWSNSL